MLDYRYHYAVMTAEDRHRQIRQPVITNQRGARRIFRLAGTRPAGRDGGRQ